MPYKKTAESSIEEVCVQLDDAAPKFRRKIDLNSAQQQKIKKLEWKRHTRSN